MKWNSPRRVCGSTLLGVVLAALKAAAQSGAVPALIEFTNVVLRPAGGIDLRSLGPTGTVHSLQVSRDLINWRTIDFKKADTGAADFQDLAAAGLNERFYRLRLDPPKASFWLTNYHGWSNSIVMSNGKVESIIVPTVGRIMQFRFAGEQDGPFWENEKMHGRLPTASSWDTAGSFGGDKIWPAPQSVWNWPPPRGFDAMVFTGAVFNTFATLTGPVDATFGARVVRQVELHPVEPLMRVTSTVEKMRGATMAMSLWVITQLKDPQRVFMPVPTLSIFPKGYFPLGTLPKNLGVTNNLISLVRDASSGAKIGNDAGALLWVGASHVLLIESARFPGVLRKGYPDEGCSAEVYTNPNPAAYVELELLGPLLRVGPGDTLSATSLYTLYPRTESTPFDEARKILDP